MSERPSNGPAVTAAMMQAVLAVLGYVIIKGAVNEIAPMALLFWRAIGSAVLMFGVKRLFRDREPGTPAPGDRWRLIGLGILAVPINQALFYQASLYTTAAHIATIYALTPAFVLLIGVARRSETLTTAAAGGVVAALAGVLLVLHHAPGAPPPAGGSALFGARAQAASGNPMKGDLMLLVAMLAWALYTALSRGVVTRLGPVRATAEALAWGAIVFAPIGAPFAWRFDYRAMPSNLWGVFAWAIVVQSAFSYFLWYYAIRRLPPSRVAIFSNLQPIGTVALAAAALHQPLTADFALGTALVVGGVMAAQFARLRRPGSPPELPAAGPSPE